MNRADYRMRVQCLRPDPRTGRPDPLAVADAILGSVELALVDEDVEREQRAGSNSYDNGRAQ